jgi:hypothetical protein
MGDRHQQLAAGNEHALDLGDRAVVVLDVHERHRREHDVE